MGPFLTSYHDHPLRRLRPLPSSPCRHRTRRWRGNGAAVVPDIPACGASSHVCGPSWSQRDPIHPVEAARGYHPHPSNGSPGGRGLGAGGTTFGSPPDHRRWTATPAWPRGEARYPPRRRITPPLVKEVRKRASKGGATSNCVKQLLSQVGQYVA